MSDGWWKLSDEWWVTIFFKPNKALMSSLDTSVRQLFHYCWSLPVNPNAIISMTSLWASRKLLYPKLSVLSQSIIKPKILIQPKQLIILLTPINCHLAFIFASLHPSVLKEKRFLTTPWKSYFIQYIYIYIYIGFILCK